MFISWENFIQARKGFCLFVFKELIPCVQQAIIRIILDCAGYLWLEAGNYSLLLLRDLSLSQGLETTFSWLPCYGGSGSKLGSTSMRWNSRRPGSLKWVEAPAHVIATGQWGHWLTCVSVDWLRVKACNAVIAFWEWEVLAVEVRTAVMLAWPLIISVWSCELEPRLPEWFL